MHTALKPRIPYKRSRESQVIPEENVRQNMDSRSGSRFLAFSPIVDVPIARPHIPRNRLGLWHQHVRALCRLLEDGAGHTIQELRVEDIGQPKI